MTYSSAQFSGNRKSRFSMHPATFTDDFSRSAGADSWSWVWAVKDPVPCLPMSSYRDPWAFFPKIHFICLSCSLFLGIEPQDPITLLKLCSMKPLPALREVRLVSVVTSALLVLLPYWPSITNMLMEYDGMARFILTFKSKVHVFLLSYFWNSIRNALSPLLPLSLRQRSHISQDGPEITTQLRMTWTSEPPVSTSQVPGSLVFAVAPSFCSGGDETQGFVYVKKTLY